MGLRENVPQGKDEINYLWKRSVATTSRNRSNQSDHKHCEQCVSKGGGRRFHRNKGGTTRQWVMVRLRPRKRRGRKEPTEVLNVRESLRNFLRRPVTIFYHRKSSTKNEGKLLKNHLLPLRVIVFYEKENVRN